MPLQNYFCSLSWHFFSLHSRMSPKTVCKRWAAAMG